MKKLMIAMAAAAMVGAANAAASTDYFVSAAITAYTDKDASPSKENGQAWYSLYAMELTDAETMSGATGYAAITTWLGNNFAVNSDSVKNNEAAAKASVFKYYASLPESWNECYDFEKSEGDGFENKTDVIAFCFFDNGTDKAYNVLGYSDAYSFSFADAYVGMYASENSDYSSGWIAVAPEPTSGLLMLLGMAGLCLRRKQK